MGLAAGDTFDPVAVGIFPVTGLLTSPTRDRPSP